MRAAAIQMNSTADPAANLEAACRLVRQAGAEGAGLVVLPEKWLVLGSGEELRAGAEPLDGPAVGAMRELARLELLGPLQDAPPLDVVVRALPAAYDRDFDALRTEVRQLLRKLALPRRATPDATPPPP